MLASEFVVKLQEAIAEHGDAEVRIPSESFGRGGSAEAHVFGIDFYPRRTVRAGYRDESPAHYFITEGDPA